MSATFLSGAKFLDSQNGGGGGAVTSVVGQTGAVTGSQIAADPAFASTGTGPFVRQAGATITSITFGDGTQASFNLTSNLSGANDPYISYTNGRVEIHPNGTANINQSWAGTISSCTSGMAVGWSSSSTMATSLDTAWSRLGPASVALGNGTVGNTTGTLSLSALNLSKTITPPGTTGAQTINNSTGTVNFAAAATSLVLTNSLITTSSIIQLTITSNDTTTRQVWCNKAAGSATIRLNPAPTAETIVDFLVLN